MYNDLRPGDKRRFAYSVRRVSDFFSAEDLEAVEAAVRRAESASAGEIVCYVAGRSDPYRLAPWKGAALGALAASSVAAVAVSLGGPWLAPQWLWMTGPAAVGLATGFLVAWIWRGPRLWLAGRQLVERRVAQRSAQVFLEQEVFATRRRTGILLYVSLLEHRMVVLADAGIRAAVEDRTWESIVAAFGAAARAGRPASGLVRAVESCGELLAGQRDRIGDAGADELADRPRVEEGSD